MAAPRQRDIMSRQDMKLIREGRHCRLYRLLGAHLLRQNDSYGVRFSVWAPNAAQVSVIGQFNGWDWGATPLYRTGDDGIWTTFVPGVEGGTLYKYSIVSGSGARMDKADPYAFGGEVRPGNASVVRDLSSYCWNDQQWMGQRQLRARGDQPMAIYEVHLGSWLSAGDGKEFANYREIAEELIPYVKRMGYTHLELLPICEHPFDASWGYQTTGYFASTSRFGSPEDFMAMVDACHENGIGVFMDWVPGHFPRDHFGLIEFDGSCLYEHLDPRQSIHPHWETSIFNYGRNEARSFLLSSAMFWCDLYHIDGLRVDAVASMLYLDYGRGPGQWVPNCFGGNANLEAIAFVQDLNQQIQLHYPGVLVMAEESTAWPGVSRPTDQGGLGFSMKWNMGWMNDTLRYFARDPVHRQHHQNDLTFGMLYAWSENFILPFSHDEVVHGKGSLLAKMPGDDWQKFAGLRLLLGYMYAHPGKKLLFMGNDLAAWEEWDERRRVPWHLLEHAPHAGVNRLVQDLNRLHREEAALHELDLVPGGFDWIDCSDNQNSVLCFIRRGRRPEEFVLAVANFTPLVRGPYRVGVPQPGRYYEILNTDSAIYWGSNVGNLGMVEAEAVASHGSPYSLDIVLPPLAILLFKWAGESLEGQQTEQRSVELPRAA